MYAQLLANILVAIGYAMVLAVAIACAAYLVRLCRSGDTKVQDDPADQEHPE